MFRKQSLWRIAVLTVGVVLLATSNSEAQRRQRGQRGPGGFGQRGGGVSILANEYLQSELNFTSAQKQRVREIIIQVEGTRALTRDDIARELGLSDTQKTKIEEARRAGFDRDALRNLFRGGQGGQRPNFDEIRKKMQEIREKADAKVLEVLTPTQRTKWNQMKGKPIDREKLFQRPGGNTPRKKRPDV